MAALFYARYVPGELKPVGQLENLNEVSDTEYQTHVITPSPAEFPATISATQLKTKKRREETGIQDLKPLDKRTYERTVPAGIVIAPVSEPTTQAEKKPSTPHQGHEKNLPAVNIQATQCDTLKRDQMKRKRETEYGSALSIVDPPSKHARILSKFDKYTTKIPNPAVAQESSEEVTKKKEQINHGLEPFPQPISSPESSQIPTYATLPEWLLHPIIAPSETRQTFKSLGLGTRQTSILESKGYSHAMPIQSAVIPLALDSQCRNWGDICVSAATGSGKTLAYVLPLISSIKSSSMNCLRALIVVPTRELVRQAREMCELCAAGTGLRIGTAVGSTALNDEQDILRESDQVYRTWSSAITTNSNMSTKDWTKFNLQEYITDTEESLKVLPKHNLNLFLDIDILICTPGRLVDHLRSTGGFNLDNLEWLVIDEADRLLNESFQEWTQVVIPAISRNNIIETTHSALRRLGHSTEQKPLRKIILSATMTMDTTKLNSLQLHNPRLVKVDLDSNHPQRIPQLTQSAFSNKSEVYAVPPTLSEALIPVGDGLSKPIYLLQLIYSHIFNETSASSTCASMTQLLDVFSTHSLSNSILIFVKSSETALRLTRLLKILCPALATCLGVLVKSNKSATARKTLAAYKNGTVRIMLATDRASRGLDLPSLEHVINYDVPASLTSYIHRAGRTARAGQYGSVWTLVSHSEGRWFSSEIVNGAIERGTRVVRKVKIDRTRVGDVSHRYEAALKELGEEVISEHKPMNRVHPAKPLS
ncbi:ATP-dependent RNA helicase dbp6 [Ophidiomyces ophidiicola]|uniref:ATP-dependent RNA helicase dbp6 n=1 Tax=Ophidiomyces ophidiicola TaxID=1387563 RepID=UPI0020C36177|nr:ATP-dependent RNA helicase dbp6 [Ophidiomyces ophidiicola]KAI1939260.1 ATP-dependent RNA helicase dbp6 [Ophidiomyces ophidiicola]KAI2008625.1 ATP-dependent RNA helicase dbp6 [Ophidiomyces ophidiicola]KAI2049278.1 ATP-dependent RNA helicase dbp6 [Ophidiomyces ophidiicola]KAI2083902.1 ATP-dependent RNA helicase dbp6 [Ophidiomyces ophidiicola]KAI2139109.1 ATP-dependent RNA helicase dbp6 [Ophidiomyces ophidiicola]